MTRTFVMTMRRPHETLRLPMPVGRKLSEASKTVGALVLFCLTLVGLGVYIYQVNAAAPKGFQLRSLERRVETLQENVTVLENQLAQTQTLRAMEARIQSLGYVPVERMEFLDQRPGYAMAK